MVIAIRRAIFGAALCTTFGANAANGWTGPFAITSLYISGAENYHVRVIGAPSNPACPNGSTWYYINQSYSESKEYIATLMIAKATGQLVDIYWQADSNGYCQIIELGLKG